MYAEVVLNCMLIFLVNVKKRKGIWVSFAVNLNCRVMATEHSKCLVRVKQKSLN